MTNFHIVPAEPAMAVDLSALIQRSVRVSNAADYDAATIALICDNFSAERLLLDMARREVFAALCGAALAGTVSLGGDELHSLFVEPALQGQGLGRRLTHHIEDHARAKGVGLLKVNSSITARPFYEHLGYRLIRFEEREDGSIYRMHKGLS